MNRLLTVSILCGGLVMGATGLRAEGVAAKPAADAASTNKTVATGKAQTTCPVMPGNPIDKALFVDANGKRIYDVVVAGDGEIVKVGTTTIKTAEDLGFRPDEIVSVVSENG